MEKEKINLKKRRGAYWPSNKLKKQAVVNQSAIYKKALKDPFRFWEEQAQELLDAGDSHDAAEGKGMMRVIDEIMSIMDLDEPKDELLDMIYFTLKINS